MSVLTRVYEAKRWLGRTNMLVKYKEEVEYPRSFKGCTALDIIKNEHVCKELNIY
jgi:hypothetical protein